MSLRRSKLSRISASVLTPTDPPQGLNEGKECLGFLLQVLIIWVYMSKASSTTTKAKTSRI